MSESQDVIEIERMSIDQFAGSVVLILGAIGSLLLVIWQSKCACKCRIGFSDSCYIFDCSREPPSQEQLDNLKEETEALGPAGQANVEREKGNKVPSADKNVPEDIRKGTFPEQEGANAEPEPEVLVPGSGDVAKNSLY